MAPTLDSKYPTPSRGTSTSSWLEKGLDKKAEKDWTKAKFETVDTRVMSIKEELDETKRIALAARKRAGMPHDCLQKETIEHLSTAVDGWAKWWRGILISVIGFLIVVGSSWMYQYFTLTNEVTTTKAAVDSLQSSVKKIQASQSDLARAVERSEITQRKQGKAQVEEVRAVMKEVLQELKDELPLRTIRRDGRGS